MRKGFTLIELLAVIVILAIILVIAIPQIVRIIKNVQDSAYESNKQMMTEAAKIYMANNIGNTFNEVTTISLEDLKNNGYIKEIKDSKTGNTCSGVVTIVKNENNEYEYTPYLECDSRYELTHYSGTLISLDNPKGEALQNLKVYGNTVQKNLPEGYTELDYIESTGAQYINTGFKPNQNSRIVAEYSATVSAVNSPIF